MTPTRVLSLVLLTAVAAACDQPSATAPNAAPDPLDSASSLIVAVSADASAAAPSFSVGASPNATWSDEPVVLDFESISPAEGDPIDPVGPTYQEDGYTLVVDGDGVFSTWGSASQNYAGSTGLFLNSILNLQVVLTSDDGTLFSAESIDLAPMLHWAPRGVVTLVGTRSDGTTVTQTHASTELAFTTFELEGFSSLVELRWTQKFSGRELHQFDNIVVRDARPESKEDCFDGGWKLYGFQNQGQCLQILEAGARLDDRR